MSDPGRDGIDSAPLPPLKPPMFADTRRRPAPRETQPGETPPDRTSLTVEQLEEEGWIECGKCHDYVKSVSAEGQCKKCEEAVDPVDPDPLHPSKTISEAFLVGGRETPVAPSWPSVDLDALAQPIRRAQAILADEDPTKRSAVADEDARFLWMFLRDLVRGGGALDRLVAIARDSRDAMGFSQMHNLATAVRQRAETSREANRGD